MSQVLGQDFLVPGGACLASMTKKAAGKDSQGAPRPGLLCLATIVRMAAGKDPQRGLLLDLDVSFR